MNIPGPRAFGLLWTGQLVSTLGSALSGFALTIWVLEETSSATPFAAAVLCALVPQLILAPLTGYVADRWRPVVTMVGVELASLLLTVVALVLLRSGDLRISSVLLLITVISSLSAFQEPLLVALVPRLLEGEKAGARGFALVELQKAMQQVFPPLLGGLVYAAFGLTAVFVIDIVTYVVAAVLAAVGTAGVTKSAETNHAGFRWSDLSAGFRAIGLRSGLWGLLIWFAAVNLFVNAASVLLGPLVLALSGAATYGWIQGIGGLAAVVGAVLSQSFGAMPRKLPAIMAATGVAGVGLIGIAVAPGPILIGASWVVLMLVAPVLAVLSLLVFQAQIPGELQGRAYAVRLLVTRSLLPLAYLGSGVLVDEVLRGRLATGGSWSTGWISSLLGTSQGAAPQLVFLVAGLAVVALALVGAASRILAEVERDDVEKPRGDVAQP